MGKTPRSLGGPLPQTGGGGCPVPRASERPPRRPGSRQGSGGGGRRRDEETPPRQGGSRDHEPGEGVPARPLPPSPHPEEEEEGSVIVNSFYLI